MRWWKRSLGAGGLVLLLSGCFWPQPGAGPNRQAHNTFEQDIGVATVARLERAWAAPVDEGPVGDPVTSDQRVHAADTRSVYGFDPATGARRWEHQLAAPLEIEQPYVHDDQVLVGQWNPHANEATDPSASDRTLALDAATGALDREVTTGVVTGDRAGHILKWENSFVRLGMGGQFPFWAETLAVVDFESGASVCCIGWYGLGAPAAPVPAPLMTLGSEWIVQAGDGILDENTPPTTGNGVRGFSIDSPRSCLGAYHCPNWVAPIDGATATAPVLSDDESTAYVGTDAGTVYAVSTADGTVLWSAAVGSGVTDAPALADGWLYVPTSNNGLVVLAAGGCGAATCSPVWSADTGGSVAQQPAVANGVVFTASTSGTMRAFAAAGCGASTCPLLWSDFLGVGITGAPAVNGGRLFVGTSDGDLVAWSLADD